MITSFTYEIFMREFEKFLYDFFTFHENPHYIQKNKVFSSVFNNIPDITTKTDVKAKSELFDNYLHVVQGWASSSWYYGPNVKKWLIDKGYGIFALKDRDLTHLGDLLLAACLDGLDLSNSKMPACLIATTFKGTKTDNTDFSLSKFDRGVYAGGCQRLSDDSSGSRCGLNFDQVAAAKGITKDQRVFDVTPLVSLALVNAWEDFEKYKSEQRIEFK